jgi:acyl carrier protein
MEPTLKELTQVFRKVFLKSDLIINEKSDATTVEGWDSLTHMMLINDTERHFRINFTFEEVMSFRNAGDIIKAIEKHLRA